jgi:hypothetical protein
MTDLKTLVRDYIAAKDAYDLALEVEEGNLTDDEWLCFFHDRAASLAALRTAVCPLCNGTGKEHDGDSWQETPCVCQEES